MKKLFTLLGVVGLLTLSLPTTWAEEKDKADSAQDAAATCRQMAKEDEVPANEMQAYMEECIASMQGGEG